MKNWKTIAVAVLIVIAVNVAHAQTPTSATATFTVDPGWSVTIYNQFLKKNETVGAGRFSVTNLTNVTPPGSVWPSSTAYCVDIVGTNDTATTYTVTRTNPPGYRTTVSNTQPQPLTAFDTQAWEQATWIYQNSLSAPVSSAKYAESQVAIWQVLFGNIKVNGVGFSFDQSWQYASATNALVTASANAVKGGYADKALFWSDGTHQSVICGLVPEGSSFALLSMGVLPLMGLLRRKATRS